MRFTRRVDCLQQLLKRYVYIMVMWRKQALFWWKGARRRKREKPNEEQHLPAFADGDEGWGARKVKGERPGHAPARSKRLTPDGVASRSLIERLTRALPNDWHLIVRASVKQSPQSGFPHTTPLFEKEWDARFATLPLNRYGPHPLHRSGPEPAFAAHDDPVDPRKVERP
jgi:hypothetical protein